MTAHVRAWSGLTLRDIRCIRGREKCESSNHTLTAPPTQGLHTSGFVLHCRRGFVLHCRRGCSEARLGDWQVAEQQDVRRIWRRLLSDVQVRRVPIWCKAKPKSESDGKRKIVECWLHLWLSSFSVNSYPCNLSNCPPPPPTLFFRLPSPLSRTLRSPGTEVLSPSSHT